MATKLTLFLSVLIIYACKEPDTIDRADNKSGLTEFSNHYSDPITETFYSRSVADSFRIFISLPKGYEQDTTTIYPLILVLDANAFFEQVVSELKFNTFIGLIPKSIVIGIGYKNFMTMDSLRTRDYTFPIAIPEYEMDISGGADKFKNFIDNELLPKLGDNYRVDSDKMALCGHSLGGYFTLYYALRSINDNEFRISNIVSASPSLHYNNRYIFEMAKNILSDHAPMKLYISMGSEDMEDEESKGILDSFERQIIAKNFRGIILKKTEFSNFGHIDAAIPGFMKGLTYLFQKE